MQFEVDDVEKLPAHLREHCEQRPDGKFIFDASRVPVPEDVTGLKSALERVKNELRDHKSTVGTLKDLGLSAADLPDLLNDKKSLVSTKQALAAEKIGRAVDRALMTAKATPAGTELLADRLAARISIEDGKLVIAGPDGQPMTGSGPDGLATLDDLVTEFTGKYPQLFLGSGSGGSGAPTRSPPKNATKTMSRGEFDRLSPADKMSRMRDGWKVSDF